jgi:proteasome beta subunit
MCISESIYNKFFSLIIRVIEIVVNFLETKEMQKYLKGTTTLAFICKSGVVVGSDTRSTMGFLISDKKSKKIYNIDDRMALTTAGLVGDNVTLVRVMKAQAALSRLEKKPLTIKGAANLLSNILYSRRGFPFMVQLVLAGYDSAPHVYELDAVGGMSEKSVSATGSGRPTAYGVLESEYKEGMSLEDGIKLAVKAVKSAMERDAASGNHIDIVTVTGDGYAEVPQETIKEILKSFE